MVSKEPFLDMTVRMPALEARVGRIPVSGRYHLPPKTIGLDYKVLDDVLGSGCGGVVRSAQRVGSVKEDSKFAVKLLPIRNLSRAKHARLSAEVEVFLCMDHPHVARLHDVYESVDMIYLVMECLDGGALLDRVLDLKHFRESDAADTVYQMLLAINYIHSHGVVHRDLKLENFLYDCKGSNHLKLLDFGFSKFLEPNTKMRRSCGTLSYLAPEVLKQCYTSQCDLWSVGVITYIILSGSMPFSGSQIAQAQNITCGRYRMDTKRWTGISDQAQVFVRSLLEVNPETRSTAASALQHPWILRRLETQRCHPEANITNALRDFAKASKFRQCCLSMMAWSLPREDRAKVQQYFLSMDENKCGTITFSELGQVLIGRFQVSDAETLQVFDALDSNNDEEIHYSDFLAAMMNHQIDLHDELLKSTFKRFDTDRSGFITLDNLLEVFGDTVDGIKVEKLLDEADAPQDGRISYPEFVTFLRGDPLVFPSDVGAAKITETSLNLHDDCEKPHHSIRFRGDRHCCTVT